MTAWSVYVYYTAYVHSLCYIVTLFVFSYEHLKSYYTARIPITYLAVTLSTATNDYDSLPGTVGEEVKSKLVLSQTHYRPHSQAPLPSPVHMHGKCSLGMRLDVTMMLVTLTVTDKV